MSDSWLIDAEAQWIWHFHHDTQTRQRESRVFIDRGRPMAEGPPLLKERRYLPQDAAEQLWRSLQSQGWTPLPKPAWSASADV